MPRIERFFAGTEVNDWTSGAFGGAAAAKASGGTVTESGAYTIHTFTATGGFAIPPSSPLTEIDVLVVAGGGAGGGGHPSTKGGGGGAGGVRTFPAEPVSAGDHFGCIVGAGGVATTAGNSDSMVPGNDSSISPAHVSAGGGGGGARTNPTGTPNVDGQGVPGGSGGGAGADGSAGTGNVPPVSPAQGFAGGENLPTMAGGGGGAGELGWSAGYDPSPTVHPSPAPAVTEIAGYGGNGLYIDYSGTGTYYGGGGGGGTSGPSVSGGSGGAGGGGAGGYHPGPVNKGVAGTANLGGGGGGSTAPTSNLGGNGGSGIIIIRYPT